MKILFFTSRFPYPLDKGDKLRAFHQISDLSENHEIHLVSIVDDDIKPEWLSEVHPYAKGGITLIRIRPLERMKSLFISLIYGLPLQIGWFYSNSIKEIISELYKDICPDHIFCQLLRMAEYVKDLPGPKTLDYMDGFGTSMDRRAKIAYFPLDLFFKFEAKRMMAYEKEIAAHFDYLTIISNQDKSLFDFPEAEKMVVVSNGISEYFTDFESKNSEKEFDLVFVGNMSYLPNIETVKYIVNDILPLLPGHFNLLISGTNPAKQVLALASERVTVTGWVDDIREFYTKGRIFIVPMWSGTGQQNKILEALALGVPCITTHEVNNAIGAIHEREILIAENKEAFAHYINLLTTDRTLYTKLSTNGKQFVKENYTWKQKAEILNSIFAPKLK